LKTALDLGDGYVKMVSPPNIIAFKNATNGLINNQPTYVATIMHKTNGIFLANKKMDYRYFMAQANNRARVEAQGRPAPNFVVS
jgi:hypothetical protein